jgi:isopentenyl phosphate kinase
MQQSSSSKAKKRPLIVKLGGSVITDKRRPFVVKRKVLGRLARELSRSRYPLVVVHGGGSFGHPLAEKYGLAEGFRGEEQLKGIALTRLAMNRLNTEVVYSLFSGGVSAIGFQPSACAIVEEGRIVSMELGPIRKALQLGLTPVLYGDVVLDRKQGVTILSGDGIATRLAEELHARRVILGVDVDGVFTSNPKVTRNAKLLREITPESWGKLSFGVSGVKDVTGGMRSKVEELLKLAEAGIESEIANALNPGVIERLVKGEKGLGTVVRGSRK